MRLPLRIDVPANMVCMTFRGTVNHLAEFSQDVLDELAHMVPEELPFKETDHYLSWSARDTGMCVWNAHDIQTGPVWNFTCDVVC